MKKSIKMTSWISWHKNLVRILMLTGAGALCLTTQLVLAEVEESVTETAVAAPSLSGRIYVSDDLKTALRTGPTTNHRIIAFLESGTPLNVISSAAEWVEVDVTGSDRTGWISRLSVQKGVGAKALLAEREETIARLQEELSQLQNQIAELTGVRNQTEESLESVTEQFDRLNKEYEELQSISKSAVNSHTKMQEMQNELATVKTQYSELEMAHTILQQDNYNRGMVHALIAVIFGVIVTLIVPRLKTRSNANRW